MPAVHNVYADQPYIYFISLTKKRGSDGAIIPATGMLDLEMYIAAVSGGPPIHTDLVVIPVERSAMPGTYDGEWPTLAINTWLKGTFNRRKVYIRTTSLVNPDVTTESETTFYDIRSL